MIFIAFIFLIKTFAISFAAFNCRLPEGCKIKSQNQFNYFDQNENGYYLEHDSIICDIKSNDYEFKFAEPVYLFPNQSCKFNKVNVPHPIIFRWPLLANGEKNILNKKFNFTNLIKYAQHFMPSRLNLELHDLNGFDLDLDISDLLYKTDLAIGSIYCIGCTINFYVDSKLVNSCKDIIDYWSNNNRRVISIFQIWFTRINDIFALDKTTEYKQSLCPLVFNNSRYTRFVVVNLMDTFYKKNVLSFRNETLDRPLGAFILNLQFNRILNINLDLKILNPSIFNLTNTLGIARGSLNSISPDTFAHFRRLFVIQLVPSIFKKLAHKQGIEWIKGINSYFIKFNLTDFRKNYYDYINVPKYLILDSTVNKRIELYKIFPDEDFCLYKDFPFDKLVILYEFIEENIFDLINMNKEFTCTYLWLVQYYESYYAYLIYLYSKKDQTARNIFRVLNSSEFKQISRCNFEQRIQLCNKSSTLKFSDVWDEGDYLILNKKFQIVFKISLFPVSLLGLATNFLVIVILIFKDNADLFKEFRQYSYLCLNSVFCLLILTIEILSWMTECFYPFEVFCPQTRKLIPIQFFKVIFKECLVTAFRFMCNFTYVAFALNRISLIGKDHGKVVKFMSEVGIKKYIAITFFISLALSWMKFFKYEINYNDPHLSYPISNEWDLEINSMNSDTKFKDAYMILISISDLINYVVYPLICFVIDICMVVKLRRTLDEKSKKSETMMVKASQTSQKPKKSMKEENDEVINKAIKMVVLNSVIGLMFKVPVCFLPVINVYAQFYYKNELSKYLRPRFAQIYSMLLDAGFLNLIFDFSYLLFTVSLSIQMFIYKRFDKKFRTGYDRLVKKILKRQS